MVAADPGGQRLDWPAMIGHLAIRVMKLVGLSRASSERFVDLV